MSQHTSFSKIKNYYFLISLILLGISSKGNAQVFNWVKGIGGTGDDRCGTIVSDPFGNTYSTGTFNGTTDFDPGPGVFSLTSNAYDLYILKLDPVGNFVWAKKLSSTQSLVNVSSSAIQLDAFNNVYLSVKASATITLDYDPGPGVYNLTNAGATLLKLDSGGNFISAKILTNSDNISYRDITFDGTGNIYACGSFTGVCDFNPNDTAVYTLTTPSFVYNGFISKLDSSGNFVWAKQLKATAYISGCTSIKMNTAQDLIISGSFSDSTDFDPGIGVFKMGVTGNSGGYILKLDQNGNFIWAEKIDGIYSDYAYSMVLDPFDNIYVTGSFMTQTDFDPGPGIYNLTTLFSLSGAYVLKLDVNGNFRWARAFGATSAPTAQNVIGWDIAIDASANVFICGLLQGTADFDPGPATFNLISAGNDDSFLAKVDSTGNFLGAKSMGGSGVEACYSLSLDAGGNCYVQGNFRLSANFNSPNSAPMTSLGSSDVFVEKFSVFGVGIAENTEPMKPILAPNPTNGTFQINLAKEEPLLEVTVFDSFGREISRSMQQAVSTVSASISGEKGMYFVKIKSPSTNASFKVVKQ